MIRGATLLQLQEDEGYRDLVYDDKTGCALVKGEMLEGNPTIGFGWNVAALPLTKAQYTNR